MPEARDVAFESTGGVRIAGRWLRPSNPHGSLVIGHGLGEHGGFYEHVAAHLEQSLGLAVLTFDFRGHGRSPGKRGYVRICDELLDDWTNALAFAARECAQRPRFALGHSYGGLSALMAASRDQLPCDGLILSNPALCVRMPVPSLKVAAGRLLRVVAPSVTLSAPLPVEHLTRDPVMQRRRQEDLLAHDRISAPLYFGMREGAVHVLAHPERIRLPLLMLLGEADPIIDSEISWVWFDVCASQDKTLHKYPDRVHEPLSDLGRGEVLDDISAWLRPRLA